MSMTQNGKPMTAYNPHRMDWMDGLAAMCRKALETEKRLIREQATMKKRAKPSTVCDLHARKEASAARKLMGRSPQHDRIIEQRARDVISILLTRRGEWVALKELADIMQLDRSHFNPRGLTERLDAAGVERELAVCKTKQRAWRWRLK